MQIFVINLDGSSQRMAEMGQRLKRLNLAFEREPAVNGAKLSADQLHKFYQPLLNRKHYRRPLSAGEIGCYLSHRNCWQKIRDQQFNHALILEDDAELDDRLPSVLASIAQIAEPWDIIKLCDPPKKKTILDSVTIASVAKDSGTADGDFKLCLYNKVPSRATGYVVSAAGAIKLLKAREKFARPIDDDLQFYWEYSGNVFGIEPSPVWNAQSSLQSDIDNAGNRKCRTSLLRQLKGVLMKIRYELLRIKYNRLRKVDLSSYRNP